MAASTELDPPVLDVRLRPGGDDLVLDVAGDLVQGTGPLLHAAVSGALDAHPSPRELVMDLSELRFCDSGGLNALVRAHHHARAAGTELHLLNPTTPVAFLLHLTGVAQVLRVSPNPAAATRAAANAP
ncbi:anti-anti-sigma factor [Kitasatospora herbaricolor]|uniref:STAS domain-containing protein n=1 Tax=Kitasatospora herbaricolor TaxID=68217 RepID=UPI00278F3B88|nr:STAS domain-containing protein [Kitasatospora herbaricolor]MDQ0306720.1 anti-anti-sigma factor [Kitasatospora herbaricolor]